MESSKGQPRMTLSESVSYLRKFVEEQRKLLEGNLVMHSSAFRSLPALVGACEMLLEEFYRKYENDGYLGEVMSEIEGKKKMLISFAESLRKGME